MKCRQQMPFSAALSISSTFTKCAGLSGLQLSQSRAKSRFRVYEARCDSAEQTLIEGLRVAAIKAGLGIDIRNAVKGPINDRIAFINSIIAQERFFLLRGCVNTCKAMCEAVYDSKRVAEDIRLDNGTTNIDSLDSMEYAVEPVMHDILYLG